MISSENGGGLATTTVKDTCQEIYLGYVNVVLLSHRI